MYRVDDDSREFLVSQPESGMGYQLVQKKDDGFENDTPPNIVIDTDVIPDR